MFSNPLRAAAALLCTLVALAAVASDSIAQTRSPLDQLQSDTLINFYTCTLAFEIAEGQSSSIRKGGYGMNSPESKKAYKEAHECANKAKQKAEARFAQVRQELASNEAATAALKEAYIYWRAEMSLGNSDSRNAVMAGWRTLLERVRVEASW
jgi:hypothetical protein